MTRYVATATITFHVEADDQSAALELAAQVAAERPREPLTDACTVHAGRRTVIRQPIAWSEITKQPTAWAAPHCLACLGCPRCAAHQVWQQIEEDDAGLFRFPLAFEGRLIRGDWWCLRCSELLVRWAEYRRQLAGWLAGNKARAEGYRRPEERAA